MDPNAPQQPNTPPMAPPAPAESPAPEAGKNGKASLNPFAHIWNGVKNFCKTNFVTGVVLNLFLLVVSYGVSFAFVAALLSKLNFSEGADAVADQVPALVATVVVGLLLYLAMTAFFSQAVVRSILTGTRLQKVGVKDSLKISWQRFWLTLAALFLAIGVFLGAVLVVALLVSIHGILGFLGATALFVLTILAVLRFLYVPFVLIDDERPTGVIAAYKSSAAVWHRSQGATILMVVTLIVGYIVFTLILSSLAGDTQQVTYSAETGYFTTNDGQQLGGEDTNFTSSDLWALMGGGVVGVIVGALLSTIVTVIADGGFANIYNQVKGRQSKSAPDSSPTPPAV